MASDRYSIEVTDMKQLLTLVIVASMLLITGCHADAPPTTSAVVANPPQNQEPAMRRVAALIREKKPVTIVLWGDSISEVGRSATWNGGASAPEKNYGSVLVRELRTRFPQSTFTLIHAGIGGQNTYEGLGRLDSLAALKPDLVVVGFGTNDTCYHFLQPEETGRAMEEMLKRIKPIAEAVCVGTGGNNPSDVSFKHVAETIDATRRAAGAQAAPFVDMRAVMMAATDQGRRWADFNLNATNCHPNDRGHEVWGKAVAETIIQALAAE
jgi:lysophospholipase L1-like esterase